MRLTNLVTARFIPVVLTLSLITAARSAFTAIDFCATLCILAEIAFSSSTADLGFSVRAFFTLVLLTFFCTALNR